MWQCGQCLAENCGKPYQLVCGVCCENKYCLAVKENVVIYQAGVYVHFSYQPYNVMARLRLLAGAAASAWLPSKMAAEAARSYSAFAGVA